MNLDKRIVDSRKYLDIFDTEEAQKYVGQKCYFTDKITRFENLDDPELVKATLTNVKKDREYCYGSDEIGLADNYYARYILPFAWVKEPEKMYRPYTLSEFVNQFSLGDEIIVRLKDKEKISHKLFVEHDENDDDDMVCLGSVWYDLVELYDGFEIYTGEGWKPFGVKE